MHVCSFVSLVVRHVHGIYIKVLRQSFSSGVYLTNHSSESILIWTMGTLEGLHPYHEFWFHGGAGGQNLEHL